MPGEIERSVAIEERFRERGERFVLRLRERHVVGALELDADGEIVASLAAVPARCAGVPCALVGIDVLDDAAIAPDRKTDPGPWFDWKRYRDSLA